MGDSQHVGTAVELVAVVFLVALVAGQAFGQPILLSYVTTGSMEPTLDPGDGFVAIPSQVTDPVEEGDVVVFRAERLHGGGLTTHRVVEETDHGYVTKGDANPFTDQAGDEPPVKDAQVVAVAWQPGGDVFVIPAFGTAVSGVRSVLDSVQRALSQLLGARALIGPRGLAYVLFAASTLYYIASAWRDDGAERTRTRERDTGTNPRLLAAGLTVVVVVAATASMVAPAGSNEFGVVSAETDSPGPRVIEQGTRESVVYPVHNTGFVPVITYVESDSDRVTVGPNSLAVPAHDTRNVTVTLSAPPSTGYYRQFVVEHRYLALLPREAIDALYRIHPWLPIAVLDVLIGGSFYRMNRWILGTGRLRSRSNARESTIRHTLEGFK